MQKSWRADNDKLTFIILDRSQGAATPGVQPQGGGMCGDINLFFNDHDDRHTVEIDVMVAEVESRRKGIGQEAVQMIMAYASDELGVKRFVAKILEKNAPSVAMFQKLGFRLFRRLEWAHEIHYEYVLPGSVDEEGIERQVTTLDGRCRIHSARGWMRRSHWPRT